MYYRRYQQGGAAPEGADQMQQQILQLVQAAMQGDQQAQQQIQQIMEAAQQGDQQAIQIAQVIQQVVEAMQSQAQRAKLGGKLDYIHKLRTGVLPDEEVYYQQKGGVLQKKIRYRNSEKFNSGDLATSRGSLNNSGYYKHGGGLRSVKRFDIGGKNETTTTSVTAPSGNLYTKQKFPNGEELEVMRDAQGTIYRALRTAPNYSGTATRDSVFFNPENNSMVQLDLFRKAVDPERKAVAKVKNPNIWGYRDPFNKEYISEGFGPARSAWEDSKDEYR